jgi:signal recognition particle receptor subunit beta
MRKKLVFCLLALNLTFGIAYADNSLDDNFNTPNKLIFLCDGNNTQREMCSAYMAGFLQAIRVASVVPILKFDFQSYISPLTIEREMKNTITNNPKIGDDLTEGVMIHILSSLGIIKIKY